jgi:hypothetical protein
MGLKEVVMELLLATDTAPLERLASSDRRVARHLLGRLWDPDAAVRDRAASALGAAAAAHPELGIEVIRRLIWALNDESATNGLFGLAALGEIGYRDPELIEPFVGPMVSYAWDDGLRKAILRAARRIAESAPRIVAPQLAELFGRVNSDDLEERRLMADLEQLVREDHG